MEAYSKGDFQQAREEFSTVMSLAPSDETILISAQQYYNDSQKQELHEKIRSSLQNGLNYLKEKDYLSLLEELKKAQEAISKISIQ